MQWISELVGLYNELLKNNPIAGGLLSVWGLSTLTFLLRNVPATIASFLKKQCTTTLEFTNDQISLNYQTYIAFMDWFEKSRWARWSRSLSLNGRLQRDDNGNATAVGIGDGNHFFIYKGRPCWMRRMRIEKEGAFNLQYEVFIRVLGRDRRVVLDLFEEFRIKDSDEHTRIYEFSTDSWVELAKIRQRHHSTVIVNREVKQHMFKTIDEFIGSRSWYEQRGLAYKLTYLLHGLPGTGKSSLIKAIASRYKMQICILSIASMSDRSLVQALATLPNNSLLSIEDFDSADATRVRKSLIESNARDTLERIDGERESSWKRLTLSGILNALDGIVPLDGSIVFLTTNVLNALDPALVRAGRVDHVVELKKLEDGEIRDYIRLMFPTDDLRMEKKFMPILGCDLQKLYLAHRNSVAKFIQSIPTENL